MTVPEDTLRRKVDTLPDGPGVYLWKDGTGRVIYVGKAKRLRARVRSYLTPGPDSPKHLHLARLLGDVETIVVADEAQSLLLENNLIKEYQPRFNIRLKDDKSYPCIAVTLAEPVPSRPGHPAARSAGRPLLRSVHGSALRRTLAVIRRIFTVGAAPTISPGNAGTGPASTTTSAAAGRRAWVGRRRRSIAPCWERWSPFSRATPPMSEPCCAI